MGSLGIREDTHASSKFLSMNFSFAIMLWRSPLHERVISVTMQRTRYRLATLKAAGFEHQVYNKQQLKLYAIFRS